MTKSKETFWVPLVGIPRVRPCLKKVMISVALLGSGGLVKIKLSAVADTLKVTGEQLLPGGLAAAVRAVPRVNTDRKKFTMLSLSGHLVRPVVYRQTTYLDTEWSLHLYTCKYS